MSVFFNHLQLVKIPQASRTGPSASFWNAEDFHSKAHDGHEVGWFNHAATRVVSFWCRDAKDCNKRIWISVATCWVQNIMLLTGCVVAVCVLWLSWHPWPLSCTVIDFEKVGLSRCHDFPQTPTTVEFWMKSKISGAFSPLPSQVSPMCCTLTPAERGLRRLGHLGHDDFIDRWWPMGPVRCQAAASNFFCVTKAGKFSMQMFGKHSAAGCGRMAYWRHLR